MAAPKEFALIEGALNPDVVAQEVSLNGRSVWGSPHNRPRVLVLENNAVTAHRAGIVPPLGTPTVDASQSGDFTGGIQIAIRRYRTSDGTTSQISNIYPPPANTPSYTDTTVVDLSKLNDTAAQTYLAQTFKVTAATTLENIVQVSAFKVYLKRVGTPAGGGTAVVGYIYALSGSDPATPITGGTPIATADISSSAYGWVGFTLATPVSLSTGVLYAIVLRGDYTASTTDYIAWKKKLTGNPYPDGSAFKGDAAGAFTALDAGASDFLFDFTGTGLTDNPRGHTTYLNVSAKKLVITFPEGNGTTDWSFLDESVANGGTETYDANEVLINIASAPNWRSLQILPMETFDQATQSVTFDMGIDLAVVLPPTSINFSAAPGGFKVLETFETGGIRRLCAAGKTGYDFFADGTVYAKYDEGRVSTEAGITTISSGNAPSMGGYKDGTFVCVALDGAGNEVFRAWIGSGGATTDIRVYSDFARTVAGVNGSILKTTGLTIVVRKQVTATLDSAGTRCVLDIAVAEDWWQGCEVTFYGVSDAIRTSIFRVYPDGDAFECDLPWLGQPVVGLPVFVMPNDARVWFFGENSSNMESTSPIAALELPSRSGIVTMKQSRGQLAVIAAQSEAYNLAPAPFSFPFDSASEQGFFISDVVPYNSFDSAFTCVAPDVRVTDRYNNLYFWGVEGLYLYDGHSVKLVSASLERERLAQYDRTQFASVRAAYDPDHRYAPAMRIAHIRGAGQTVFDKQWVVVAQGDAHLVWNTQSAAIVDCLCHGIAADGRSVVIVAGSNRLGIFTPPATTEEASYANGKVPDSTMFGAVDTVLIPGSVSGDFIAMTAQWSYPGGAYYTFYLAEAPLLGVLYQFYDTSIPAAFFNGVCMQVEATGGAYTCLFISLNGTGPTATPDLADVEVRVYGYGIYDADAQFAAKGYDATNYRYEVFDGQNILCAKIDNAGDYELGRIIARDGDTSFRVLPDSDWTFDEDLAPYRYVIGPRFWVWATPYIAPKGGANTVAVDSANLQVQTAQTDDEPFWLALAVQSLKGGNSTSEIVRNIASSQLAEARFNTLLQAERGRGQRVRFSGIAPPDGAMSFGQVELMVRDQKV